MRRGMGKGDAGENNAATAQSAAWSPADVSGSIPWARREDSAPQSASCPESFGKRVKQQHAARAGVDPHALYAGQGIQPFSQTKRDIAPERLVRTETYPPRQFVNNNKHDDLNGMRLEPFRLEKAPGPERSGHIALLTCKNLYADG